EEAVRAKLTHDFAGHYNRPDVFQLRLNTAAPQILQRGTWTAGTSDRDPGGEELPASAESRHPAQPGPDDTSSDTT
ncbi:MAG: hypothetical protein ACK2UU_07075, partial [Anaerolineae bacterium]